MNQNRGATFGTERLLGLALAGGSTVLWSTAGVFTRAIDLDLWTMVAWRSLFACVSLLILAAFSSGWDMLNVRGRLGWPGIVYVPVAAASMIGYIAALRLTTVANVMTIYATMPFMAAGIGYLLLGERIGRDLVIAGGVAFVGVACMAGFATDPGGLLGNTLALLMTLGFAMTVVMAQRWRDLDVTLAIALASGLCGLGCALGATSDLPGGRDLLLLFLFSLATQSLSYLLFMAGGRRITAAEAGLITLLDVVLGPLWVWLAFAEWPGLPALVGGGLTLSAVVWYMRRQMRIPRAV